MDVAWRFARTLFPFFIVLLFTTSCNDKNVDPVKPTGLLNDTELISITVFEMTGSLTVHTFPKDDSRLVSDVDQNPPESEFDFKGTATEFYDIYVSDVDGNLDSLGAYLTIECYRNYCPATVSCGGNNLDAVALNFSGAEVQWATQVESVVMDYPGFPDSVYNALGPADASVTCGGCWYSRMTFGFGAVARRIASTASPTWTATAS